MQLLASFPPWSEVLLNNLFFEVIAVAIFVVGIGAAVYEYRRPEGYRLGRFLAAILFAVLGAAQITAVLAFLYTTSRFRRFIDRNEIVAFEVRRFPDEAEEPDGPVVRFEHKDAIADALAMLDSAGSRARNHETFEDGYSIRLVAAFSAAPKDMRILFFKSSQQIGNDHPGAGAVIPAIETGLRGGRRLGEYSCPAFEKWIQEYIDPVMAAEASYRELLLAMQEGDEDAARRLTTELGFRSLLRSYDPGSDVAEADVEHVLKDRGQLWSAQQVRWDWVLWRDDEPIVLAAHGKPSPLLGGGMRFRQADGAWKLDEVVLGK